jgi:hypothetical protein
MSALTEDMRRRAGFLRHEGDAVSASLLENGADRLDVYEPDSTRPFVWTCEKHPGGTRDRCCASATERP